MTRPAPGPPPPHDALASALKRRGIGLAHPSRRGSRVLHDARDIGPGTGQMLFAGIAGAGRPLSWFTGEPPGRCTALPCQPTVIATQEEPS